MSKQTMVVFSVMSLLVIILAANSVTSSRPAKNDITCEEGMMKMLPCQPFLKGSEPARPSAECCVGVKEVFREANTTAVRRDLCECFKKAAGQLRLVPERAKLIPDLCHVSISFPIDPKMDCSS